jgi:hypothetical protein
MGFLIGVPFLMGMIGLGMIAKELTRYSFVFLIFPTAWMLGGLKRKSSQDQDGSKQKEVTEEPWAWRESFYANLFRLVTLLAACIVAFVLHVPGDKNDNLRNMFQIWGHLSTYIDHHVWKVFGVGLGTSVLAYCLTVIACSMNMLVAFSVAAGLTPLLCLYTLFACPWIGLEECAWHDSTKMKAAVYLLACGQIVASCFFLRDIFYGYQVILLKETQVKFSFLTSHLKFHVICW